MNEINPVVSQAQAVVFSAKLMKDWQEAVFTVKDGQDKFLKCYKRSFTERLGKGWEEKWKTDLHFPDALAEIEAHIKAVCLTAGMKLTTFNRYRNAARKAVLLNVPFSMGTNLTSRKPRRRAT